MKIFGLSGTNNTSSLKPTKATLANKEAIRFLKNAPKEIWKHFKKNFPYYFIAALTGLAFHLWHGYITLDKQDAVFEQRIKNFEKGFEDYEVQYRENIKKDLSLAKCKNAKILECYNKCGVQELIRRQNECEFSTK